MNGRLYRSPDRVFAGVAGGVADYVDIDPSIVRVLWAVLTLFSGGILLLVYIIMAFIVPEEPKPSTEATPASGTDVGAPPPVTDWREARRAEREARRAAQGDQRSGRGPLVLGVILVIVGGVFLIREFFPGLDFDRIWPIALVLLGLVLLAGSMRRD